MLAWDSLSEASRECPVILRSKENKEKKPTNARLCDNFPRNYFPPMSFECDFSTLSICLQCCTVLYLYVMPLPLPLVATVFCLEKKQLHLPFRPIPALLDAAWVRKLSLQHDLPHTLNQEAVKPWVLSLVFRRPSCAGLGNY